MSQSTRCRQRLGTEWDCLFRGEVCRKGKEPRTAKWSLISSCITSQGDTGGVDDKIKSSIVAVEDVSRVGSETKFVSPIFARVRRRCALDVSSALTDMHIDYSQGRKISYSIY